MRCRGGLVQLVAIFRSRRPAAIEEVQEGRSMVTTPPESPSPNTSPAQRGSLRTHVVDVLELLEVPVPRHLLQDVLACRGVTVDLRQLSNLRRAEERAFRTVPTETDRLLV